MRESSETSPTLASCLAVIALVGVLVHDQIWAKAEFREMRMGAEATSPPTAEPASRSSEPATESKDKAEPEVPREPPRVRIRVRHTLPA